MCYKHCSPKAKTQIHIGHYEQNNSVLAEIRTTRPAFSISECVEIQGHVMSKTSIVATGLWISPGPMLGQA